MAENEAKKPVKVTRDELYKQVWERPMQHLAAQYGISGNGLAKICDRLNVPYPYRGYWAKKEAGKPVRQVELPPVGAGAQNEAMIVPTPPRVALSTPTMSAKIQEQYDSALNDASTINVPDVLRRPHAIVAEWIAERARQIAEAKRSGSAWVTPPAKFTDLEVRRHRILDTLFKEMEKRGFKIMYERYQGFWLQIGRERVDVTLNEKIRQIRRPITPEEKKDWFYRNQQWRQLKVPTGTLVFKIKTYLSAGIRSEWVDEAEFALEKAINEIVAVLALAGPLLNERRRIAEEQEQQRLEAERRRTEEANRRRRERNRWRGFLELSEKWREAQAAREFISALENQPVAGQEPIGNRTSDEWLNWARERLLAHNPLFCGAEGVWKNLADVTDWEYRDS